MPRLYLHLSVFVLGCLFALSAFAAPLPVPSAPEFKANSYLLMDFDSGKILAEHKSDERVEPASITKIMTAYVVYHALRQGQISDDGLVLISEKAWRMHGSRMFIEVGKRVKVIELLKGLIVQSGNDASVALAEHVAGTEEAFVQLMNSYARELGMNNTLYQNSTGLPHAEHFTTAKDIAILTRALINEFPERYKLYSQKEFTYNGITQANRNKLLWRDNSVDGVKTGHTESAGYCLVSSARRDSMRLISVILGTESKNARTVHSGALLNYGFRFFETHKLYSAGEQLTEMRVWQGEKEMAGLGLAEDLYITILRGRYNDLEANMELNPDVQAPVSTGEIYGRVNIVLQGTLLEEASLVALESVPKGGLFRRAMDAIQQLIK